MGIREVWAELTQAKNRPWLIGGALVGSVLIYNAFHSSAPGSSNGQTATADPSALDALGQSPYDPGAFTYDPGSFGPGAAPPASSGGPIIAPISPAPITGVTSGYAPVAAASTPGAPLASPSISAPAAPTNPAIGAQLARAAARPSPAPANHLIIPSNHPAVTLTPSQLAGIRRVTTEMETRTNEPGYTRVFGGHVATGYGGPDRHPAFHGDSDDPGDGFDFYDWQAPGALLPYLPAGF